MLQTETASMKAWQESGWTIKTFNIPVLVTAPPAARVELEALDSQDVVSIGGFELIYPSRGRVIDTLTHQTLLEQSLREHEGIWRTLAER